MTIALAATWEPRGELARLLRLLPWYKTFFPERVMVLPPNAPSDIQDALRQADPEMQVIVTDEWAQARFVTVQKALGSSATHIFYVDGDRLIRWAETRPQEFEAAMRQIEQHDCIIWGRTDSSYKTHPNSLLLTERMSNTVLSYLVGQSLDFSAGAKSFSRRAAEFLMLNAKGGHGLGADGEWPLLLHRAGFTIMDYRVEGLDWETADRYRDSAADAETQRHEAEKYDQDVANWRMRVEVAQGIIDASLGAMQRDLKFPEEQHERTDQNTIGH